mmetsp:Transcript_123010/g.282064  ORF Transcript_123010/g.282064 Transcript_123010/m.282064 type:complete len:555 (-) Transcript_123010:215-1879(-)
MTGKKVRWAVPSQQSSWKSLQAAAQAGGKYGAPVSKRIPEAKTPHPKKSLSDSSRRAHDGVVAQRPSPQRYRPQSAGHVRTGLSEVPLPSQRPRPSSAGASRPGTALTAASSVEWDPFELSEYSIIDDLGLSESGALDHVPSRRPRPTSAGAVRPSTGVTVADMERFYSPPKSTASLSSNRPSSAGARPTAPAAPRPSERPRPKSAGHNQPQPSPRDASRSESSGPSRPQRPATAVGDRPPRPQSAGHSGRHPAPPVERPQRPQSAGAARPPREAHASHHQWSENAPQGRDATPSALALKGGPANAAKRQRPASAGHVRPSTGLAAKVTPSQRPRPKSAGHKPQQPRPEPPKVPRPQTAVASQRPPSTQPRPPQPPSRASSRPPRPASASRGHRSASAAERQGATKTVEQRGASDADSLQMSITGTAAAVQRTPRPPPRPTSAKQRETRSASVGKRKAVREEQTPSPPRFLDAAVCDSEAASPAPRKQQPQQPAVGLSLGPAVKTYEAEKRLTQLDRSIQKMQYALDMAKKRSEGLAKRPPITTENVMPRSTWM